MIPQVVFRVVTWINTVIIGAVPALCENAPIDLDAPCAGGRAGHTFPRCATTGPRPLLRRLTIAAAITQIDSAGDTNIIKGLLAGEQELQTGSPEKPKALVLLTDGALGRNLTDDSLQWEVLDELLTRFLARGWRIHCVALSVEDPRLPPIAERTGGIGGGGCGGACPVA